MGASSEVWINTMGRDYLKHEHIGKPVIKEGYVWHHPVVQPSVDASHWPRLLQGIFRGTPRTCMRNPRQLSEFPRRSVDSRSHSGGRYDCSGSTQCLHATPWMLPSPGRRTVFTWNAVGQQRMKTLAAEELQVVDKSNVRLRKSSVIRPARSQQADHRRCRISHC